MLEILGIKQVSGLVNKRFSRRLSLKNLDLFFILQAREDWLKVYYANVENKYDVFIRFSHTPLKLAFQSRLAQRNPPVMFNDIKGY